MVSIIIPTYNRPTTLRKVIDSYINQKYVKEVIIIDDGSSKDYCKLIKYMKEEVNKRKIQFKYIRNNKQKGAAFCRNIGIKNCNESHILWGEDDLFLREDYVKVLYEKDKINNIIFGSIYYNIKLDMTNEELEKEKNNQQNLKDRLFDFKSLEGYYRRKIREDIKVPYGHAIILVPKDKYFNIQYFENYKVNGYREETDAQILIAKSGTNIIYTSDTECYHLHRDVIEKGGQHTYNRVINEIYKIINNTVFINRHYEYFKTYNPNIHSKLFIKNYYIYYVLRTNINGAFRKLKRCLKREYSIYNSRKTKF